MTLSRILKPFVEKQQIYVYGTNSWMTFLSSVEEESASISSKETEQKIIVGYTTNLQNNLQNRCEITTEFRYCVVPTLMPIGIRYVEESFSQRVGSNNTYEDLKALGLALKKREDKILELEKIKHTIVKLDIQNIKQNKRGLLSKFIFH